jgi:ribosomal protein S18 acetylase RimI-like enzyme
MEDRVKFRNATSHDAKALTQLQAQLDRPLPLNTYQTRKFQKLVMNYIKLKDRGGIFVATTRTNLVGMVSYVFIQRLNRLQPELWIPELVISHDYRNRGIGKRLVQMCEDIAKRKRCYRIRLESRNDRIDSHDFYKKIGFSQMALAFEKKLQ